VPPQPSEPHCLPRQSGTHATHCPSTLHWSVPLHVPQPSGVPQLSTPHSRAPQEGTHTQSPLLVLHERPAPQVPHEPAQPSLPQALPRQLGVHAPTHCPVAVQASLPPQPGVQLPAWTPEAQPLLPHSRLVQSGVHACGREQTRVFVLQI
jgi:hypothetical protein